MQENGAPVERHGRTAFGRVPECPGEGPTPPGGLLVRANRIDPGVGGPDAPVLRLLEEKELANCHAQRADPEATHITARAP